MPWWTWVCLAVFVGLALATTIYWLVALVRLKRRFRELFAALAPSLAHLESLSVDLERRTVAADEASLRLAESLVALNASLAKLRVLAWALEDVRVLLERAAQGVAIAGALRKL